MLRLCGPSNNASSQNTAAQQQIQQAMQQAMQMYQQWLQANPFPLMNAKAPTPPPQFGSPASGGGGQAFGGPSGGLMDVLKKAQSKRRTPGGQGTI